MSRRPGTGSISDHTHATLSGYTCLHGPSLRNSFLSCLLPADQMSRIGATTLVDDALHEGNWDMRLPTFLTILCLMLTVAASGGEIPFPSGERIVSPHVRLELLFTRTAEISGGLTEGPAVAPDGSIYFSDIPFGKDQGMILRFDPRAKTTTIFSHDSGKSNGLIFDADGYLLACEGAGYGGRRISRWDVKNGSRTTVADRYLGKRFNAPNDLCLDRHGRIYFMVNRSVPFEHFEHQEEFPDER